MNSLGPDFADPEQLIPAWSLHVPFTTLGPFIEEDAGCVSHVYWNGSQLVDTKGNSWSMIGTVPQAATSQLYPQGFSASSRAGAGPYGAGQYYTLNNGFSLGDFTVTIVLRAVIDGNIQVFWSVGSNTDTQLCMEHISNGGIYCGDVGASKFVYDLTNPIIDLSYSVVSFVRSGSTGYLKHNLNTIKNANVGNGVPLAPMRIGGRGDVSFPFAGQMFEVMITRTVMSDAQLTFMHNLILGQVGTLGNPLSVTRNLRGSYEI
jgi:hypothetical protein